MSLRLDHITKRYGDTVVVDDFCLDIAQGEFLTLLGPSGSGKTTLLMTIAGFVEPSGGRVLLDGADITRVPPHRRDFGMVFQGYALFPHMSVGQNVMFPLRVRRMARAMAEERVRAVLDMVQLSAFADRRPALLSGGQQQRVALARALVFDPKLLLLDEPLAALDKKLRAELQEELKTLHRRIGRTFVAVTHDQDEALSMSDRVAVMRSGRLVQAGTPTGIYDLPRTKFVADFLGKSNFLKGVVREVRATSFVYAVAGERFSQAIRTDPRPPLGSPVLMSLRPEKIAVLGQDPDRENGGADNTIDGIIVSVGYVGQAFEVVARTAIGEMRALMPSWRAGFTPAPDMAIRLGWAGDAATPIIED